MQQMRMIAAFFMDPFIARRGLAAKPLRTQD